MWNNLKDIKGDLNLLKRVALTLNCRVIGFLVRATKGGEAFGVLR